ncbi:ABC-F family ATP-binding cassette domain-containing protein [Hyphococcus flavus]|uniref:ABC-F family ATP-binding cassette domain-containing protein n=1 Tax=Hyphococcus flavus TaxID=1866326 RepID=A0AAF0CBR4_9PROT|nr:ABC-F family ATP-binding cassette domain-containing protein [Hyphococcus flavus]WDI31660.1 ABC-F family ATP-binding cassette domain-containing protein [Hyphococcus flavus]
MLHINDLTYRIENRLLFDQATAAISDGWKVGFVGANGSGKSTLLRMIKGELYAGDDEISIRKNRRLGAVDQEAPSSDISLIETVLAQDKERAALIAESDSATDPHRIAEIQTRLADIDAHSAEARAGSILSGLGFSAEDQRRACAEFSGGWRMRVALAGVLFSAPDLLLLDEPTNYLDLEGTIWLEAYLKRYPYTTLIVSHDRALLNNAVTHIMALEHGKLSVHAGGYDLYEKKRAEARAQAASFRARQEARRKHMQAFVDRFRAKASKAKQAQSRVKMLERLETVAEPISARTIPFHFPNPKPMAPPIIRVVDADLGYEEGKPVLHKVNLRLDHDDRIAILGPNGEGKSTLVKALSGRLPPLAGNIYKHKKLGVAYFAQHQLDELKPKQSAYDHVRELIPNATEAETRSAAARLGFGPEKADTKVEKLSGGEKARLLLGLITFHGAHLLILDEPTNHLDIGAREALVEALNDFQGAVLLITHDAHLASSVADRLWLVNKGAASPYDGDLSDYRELIIASSKTAPKQDTKKPAANVKERTRKASAESRLSLQPLKKAAEALEKRIEALNNTMTRLDAALAEPGLFETNLPRATKLSKERSALLNAISQAETEWLEALEQYENAKALADA